MLLEFQNITAYRGLKLALDSISFDVAAGQNTVIFGPNGAGKSTLLKLMARELYPVVEDNARLKIFGEDRWNIWDLRKRLGIVSPDVQFRYTGHVVGLDVILSGFDASIGHVDRSKLTSDQISRGHEVADELGIAELLERPYGEMSDGQQRRFILARALVHRPELLTLDEPTTGLDMGGVFEFIERTTGLMNSGTTILLVTHHLHEISPAIDRVILLKEGEIFRTGTKVETLTDDNLTALFGFPLSVSCENGFYHAVPKA
jgi:iron complex transport system ATP-binding protein